MSSTNAQKTWYGSSQNQFAEKKIANAIRLLGKALPASVTAVDATHTIVTVKFEIDATPFTLPQVTVPVLGFEYIRFPIQVGCKGRVTPTDARMGAMTGLGSGLATLSTPGNLAALVFEPVGRTTLGEVDDPNAVVIYGPNGVIARNVDGTGKIVVDANHVELTFGSNSITVDDDGVHVTGTLEINGSNYLDHTHSEVESGDDDTGPVT